MSTTPRTVTITDPEHESYGRVAVILSESEWYTTVRILYHSTQHILSKEQFRINESETS